MTSNNNPISSQEYPCVHRARGATLPDVYHEFYDEVEQENPASISYGCLQIILRRNLAGSRELHFTVYKQLKRRGFYPSSNLHSDENAKLVQEIVREIRPALNTEIYEGGKPVSQQLNESEYYLQAALSKLVVKFQMLWLDTYNRDRLSKKCMQQTAARQLKFFGGRSKIRVQCTRSGPPNRDTPLLLCQGLSKIPEPSTRLGRFSPKHDSSSRSRSTNPDHDDEETIVEVETSDDIPLYDQQQSPTVSTTQRSNLDSTYLRRAEQQSSTVDVQAIHLHEMIQKFGKDFQTIIEQISMLERKKARSEWEQKSERIRQLEEQFAELEFDNAYLGYTLAQCKSVIRGDQTDLVTQFADEGLIGDTVDRLIENPRFQRKFFDVRKRKRELDDVGIKDEEAA